RALDAAPGTGQTARMQDTVYVIWMTTTPEKLWTALTSPESSPLYFFGRKVESDWNVGSPFVLRMPDGRVDSQGRILESNAPFAKPILSRLMKLVHQGCPDVVETIKWGFPHFEHKGILCSMASFKEHCAFGFWNGAMNVDERRDAMGQFGRITSVRDLPKDSV